MPPALRVGFLRGVIINNSFVFSQVDERLSNEGFLSRFLRASCWDVEGALRILKLYSNLGAEYRCYVSRAIPSR